MMFKFTKMNSVSPDTTKIFQALPDQKCIFEHFLKCQAWLHKEVLLLLPCFSLVLLLFHWLWAKDQQVSQSLLPTSLIVSGYSKRSGISHQTSQTASPKSKVYLVKLQQLFHLFQLRLLTSFIRICHVQSQPIYLTCLEIDICGTE